VIRRATSVGGIWAAAILLASCTTTRPSSENDCDLLQASDGFAQLERLAVRERVLGEKLMVDHRVCSADPSALAAFEKSVLFRGLHSERTVEGGKCVKVEVSVDPNAESAREASRQICEQARLSGARYASWNIILGGNTLLFVSGSNVSVRPIPPRPNR
jgi:hypothetical protein